MRIFTKLETRQVIHCGSTATIELATACHPFAWWVQKGLRNKVRSP
ncbi:MAG: hypothetical protein H7A51_09545 [Akkermansiaceae bacterium]|nr:hypothetical protein [Akkermansiaceae bacterium]